MFYRYIVVFFLDKIYCIFLFFLSLELPDLCLKKSILSQNHKTAQVDGASRDHAVQLLAEKGAQIRLSNTLFQSSLKPPAIGTLPHPCRGCFSNYCPEKKIYCVQKKRLCLILHQDEICLSLSLFLQAVPLMFFSFFFSQ